MFNKDDYSLSAEFADRPSDRLLPLSTAISPLNRSRSSPRQAFRIYPIERDWEPRYTGRPIDYRR
jgi:hypothetical protein